MSIEKGLEYVEEHYGPCERKLDLTTPCVPLGDDKTPKLRELIMKTPPSLRVWMACDNKRCINPKHMENLSEKEVQERKAKKFCRKCGGTNWGPKYRYINGIRRATRVCLDCKRRIAC